MGATQRAGDPGRGRRDARRRGEDDGLPARRGALQGDERRVREALPRAAAGALDRHRRPEVRGHAGGDRGHRRAAGRPVSWPYPREPARGTRGMVVSGHPLASGAGLQAPAIRYARDGFPVDRRLGQAIATIAPDLAQWPALARLLAPGGDLMQPGQVLRQPELAATLATLATEGRAAFYGGALGQTV